MQKTELLAPAGDMACLKAAILAGADAVYLGGQKFGARAYAGNFSDEELLEAFRLAHFFGKKVYLTINTLTKGKELAELVSWLGPLYEGGVDGVIVQDLGVLENCRKAFPDLALHASTQMTVTESQTALFLKKLGVCRVVPARELSLQELKEMKQETGMELEVFIHGALCYAYSGQCLFSSLLGGRSGNRGRCAQPCRQPYQILAGQKAVAGAKTLQYPLSLKDLCVLPMLPKLMEAGMDAFKIEGRMKGPEYVAGVTALYRKYMDLYTSCPGAWRVDPRDMELLSSLYVRSGLSSGYYEKHNGRDMVSLENPGYTKTPEAVLEEIRKKYVEKELTKPVNLSIMIQEGKPTRLSASCEGVCVEKEGMTAMAAQNKPLSEADVRKQLQKTGGSHFFLETAEVFLADAVFLPVSSLNELRRQALEALYGKMTRPCRRSLPGAETKRGDGSYCGEAQSGKGLSYRVSTLFVGQAVAALEMPKVRRLYLSADAVFDKDAGQLWEKVKARRVADPGFSFYLSLPVVLRSCSADWFAQLFAWLLEREHAGLVDGLQAGGLSGVLWARKYGWEKEISLQHSAYVFNEDTYAFYRRFFAIDCYTAPLEYNRRELWELPADSMEVMVYGRIPMMQSVGCVRKTAGDCLVQNGLQTQRTRSFSYSIKDRYQTVFPVLVNCTHCNNTIYNSVPLCLRSYEEELVKRKVRALRLDFTDEKPEETAGILRLFLEGEGDLPAAYTTGHFKKGVS